MLVGSGVEHIIRLVALEYAFHLRLIANGTYYRLAVQEGVMLGHMEPLGVHRRLSLIHEHQILRMELGDLMSHLTSY